MKKTIFVVVLVILGLTARLSADTEFLAEVIDCRGHAFFRDAGSPQDPWQALVAGNQLEEGAEILTKENTFVTLAIHNLFVRINPSTHFVLTSGAKRGDTLQVEGELISGEIWSKAVDVIDNLLRYEVITPTAVAGVEGTNFSVAYVPEFTEILVAEGLVAVRTRESSVPQLMLKANEGAQITAGGIFCLELADENKEHIAEMNQWGRTIEKEFRQGKQSDQGLENGGEKQHSGVPEHVPKRNADRPSRKGGPK